MRGKYDTAYKKLQDGRRELAQARDNNALTVALLYIHGALDAYLQAGSPLARTSLPKIGRWQGKGITPNLADKLYLLQRDGIIGAEDRNHVLQMRTIRNMAAHGERHSISRQKIERYAVIVEKIVDEDSARKRIAAKSVKRTARANKPPTPRTPPAPPIKQAPVVSPPPIEVAPATTDQPTVPQRPVAQQNDELLSQLLQRELGASPASAPDNDELLRQLLSL